MLLGLHYGGCTILAMLVPLAAAMVLAAAERAPHAPPAGPTLLYVATDGSDAWTGRLDAPNTGKTDGPKATLAGARDAIRELKSAQGGELKSPVHVLVRDGRYFLSETFGLRSEDSGSESCPITYAAYPRERPTISGGRPITGWKARPADGDLPAHWAASVPEASGPPWPGRRPGRWRTG